MARDRSALLILALAILALIAATLPSGAGAATKTYDGPDNGEWTTPVNWDTNTVPTATDDVVVRRPVQHTLAVGAVGRSLNLSTDGRLFVNGAGRTVTIGSGAAQPSTLRGNISVAGTSRFELAGGTATWSAGTWTGSENGVFRVSGGMLDITGNLAANNAGGGVVENSATVRHSAPGSTFIGMPYQNNGSTIVQSGTLALSGGDDNGPSGSAGGFDVRSGATLAFAGNFKVGTGITPVPLGGIVGAGTTRFDSGRVDLVDATYDVGSAAVSGGTAAFRPEGSAKTGRLVSDGQGGGVEGALAVGAGASRFDEINFGFGVVTFAPAATTTAVGDVRVSNNARVELDGATSWTGGDWTIGGFLNNRGTIAAGAGRRVLGLDSGGAESFDTEAGGTLRASGTEASPVDVQVDMDNGGLIDVAGGRLKASEIRQSGSRQGAIRLARATNLQLGRQLVLGGGSLRGFGTVLGNVVNAGGLVMPGGASPGRLSISGTYRQEPNGTLRTDIEGERPATDFDQLAVSGSARLDGTLDVDNAFDPLPADRFRVVAAGGRTGAFDDVIGEAISANKRYFPTYQANGATLEVDADPSVSVADVAVTEPDAGTRNAGFVVTLSTAARRRVAVNFATANDTARAPGDYTAKTGTLTFEPGQRTKTVNVAVKGENAREPNETFNLRLSSPRNATLGRGAGRGTIRNDD